MSACEQCGHPTGEHSREPGIGCLRRVPALTPGSPWSTKTCPCPQPGTSEADQ